ncbi:MAG: aminotransferase class I/II-fold pyridoxal phosphate-dependent enzyme [Candidatus Lokiarchaeota archaeon]|jgi:aspartate/methionine/tyrosine aminotransferase
MEFNILKKTSLYNAFSELGKRIYLPDGIFYWSGRAKSEAKLNGTIGVAYSFEKDFINDGSSDWLPCYLEDVKDFFNDVDVNDLVTYASISGLPELRQRWKNWIIEKSRFNNDLEQKEISNLKKYITHPIVTAGVTNAIFLSCSLFLNPSDYIILPNKRWGNYDNIISRFLGARIQSFEFFQNGKFNLRGLIDAMNTVIKKQNKIIMMLCFPNNPTGFIPTKMEIDHLVKHLLDFHSKNQCPIIVLIDDAYEPYIFSNQVSQRSIFYDLQQLEEDIIPVKLDGITKELLIYGGRVGFATIGLKEKWVQSDQELETLKNEIDNKLSAINRSTISNSNHFYQTIAINLIDENNIDQILKKREKIVHLLQKRYELINTLLKDMNDPKVTVDPNAGGFFVFLNLDPSVILANDFADHLLKQYKIGVIPIQNLKENINGIRIAYSSINIGDIPEFIRYISLALKNFK